MLASITPLGERGRDNRYAVTVTAYVVGSLLGGATLGAVAGGTGALVAPRGAVSTVLVSVVALVAASFDVSLTGLRLPTVRRQVNEDWLVGYRGWVFGAGFGFQLGLGVVTIVTTAAVYAAVAFAVLARSLPGGLAIGSAFGLVRGLMILMGARVRRPEQLASLHRVFVARARAASAMVVAVEVLLAFGAIAIVGAP